MRITDMHITPIALGDPPLLNAAGLHAPYALRTIVELVADNGLTGIAEVPGSAAVNTCLERAREVVVGADPFNWNALRAAIAARFPDETPADRGNKPWDQRQVVQVYSAVDVACLDLIGKAVGQPVANLLGGIVRERVPFAAYLFYKHKGAGGELGFGTDPRATGWDAARQEAALDPAGIVAQAKAMIREFGFKSIKLKGGVFEPAAEVAAMRALREAFGPELPLRLDPNALWKVETAIAAGKELESLLEYYEDPSRGQEAMAAVRKAVKLPLATNMCTTSFADIPGSVRHGSEDIILGDHHYWGGLRASLELAAICRTFKRGLSMHSNSHAGISLTAMTHLAAAVPNLSYAVDTHYPWQYEDVIKGGRLRFEDGSLAVPQTPGLGVELDRAALARLHANFKRCGLTERNDEIEMQKVSPGWKFAATRW